MEKEGHLQFLDIDIHKKTESSLGHLVYQVVTHTNLYLHRDSHHHPANEQSILASMIHRAKARCKQDSLTQELEFLTSFFQKMVTALSRYDEPLNLQHRLPRPTKDPPRLTQQNAGQIQHQKCLSLPPRKICSYLPAAEDVLGLRMSGVYSIPVNLARFILGT